MSLRLLFPIVVFIFSEINNELNMLWWISSSISIDSFTWLKYFLIFFWKRAATAKAARHWVHIPAAYLQVPELWHPLGFPPSYTQKYPLITREPRIWLSVFNILHRCAFVRAWEAQNIVHNMSPRSNELDTLFQLSYKFCSGKLHNLVDNGY